MPNIARNYKIMVAQAENKSRRDELLARLLVDAGFCKVPSDARKIMAKKVADIDLERCFFVAAMDFKFNQSHLVTQKLIRMALCGIPVFLSAKHIPNSALPFCEVIY